MLKLVKVSVIVPVYNVEDYLRQCLDSLINQTFNSMEILCINDGATDSSPSILKEYAGMDSRIRIINQENQGLAKARNTGLDNASGEFVYFMDSDDILKPYAIKKLYNLAMGKKLDMVIFKLINFYDGTKEYFSSDYYDMTFLKESVGDNVFSHRDLTPEHVYKVAVSAPGKLFKRSLIEDIRFPVGLLFEDNPFFVEAFLKAERVYFDDSYLYERRIRQDSITTTSSNKAYMDYIEIAEMMVDITKRYGLYEQYREGLYSKTLNNIYFRFTQTSEEYKDEYFRKIQDDFNAKKQEYDSDEKFTQGPERLRKIFYDGIDSSTYKEYELSVKVYDLENTIEKQNRRCEHRVNLFKEKNKELRRSNKEKAKEIRALNRKIAKNEKEITRLTNKVDSLHVHIGTLNNTISEMQNSTSWKVTKPIRLTGDFVKGVKKE